jgi:hypothetical protein
MERRDLSQLFSRTRFQMDALWRGIFCVLICAFPVCGTATAQRESGLPTSTTPEALRSLQTRDLVAAERELRAALRLRPNDARAHNALGLALGAGGGLIRRLANSRLSDWPDFVEARINLGAVLQQTGALEEAIARSTRRSH